MVTESPPLLEARGLVKHFGAVEALRDGNFELRPNELHALVGDNGAGKSTMVKIFSGAHRPDAGELRFDGHLVTIPNPLAARAIGVTTVYQDLALVNHLDVSGNLFLGHELRLPAPLSWLGFIDKKAMRRRAADEMRRLRVDITSVDQPVLGLSGGQRQAVAVGRAISWGTRIVILDEPTAALGVRESRVALELIHELPSQGFSVIMISHNLSEVFAIADRITILRLGRTIATVVRAETSVERVVGLITGAFEVGV